MNLPRKLVTELTAGSILSSIFCALLVHAVMEGGVGKSISFFEFLKDPENILFCLLMSFFIFASWLMRGINNRTVLFFWALVSVVYYVIFWHYSAYFYNVFRNIYAIFFASLVSSLPLILIIRYRVRISSFVFRNIKKLGFFENEINVYLSHAKTTDFEFGMQRILYIAFAIELFYSFYMSSYGVFNHIPYYGSIYNHLLKNGHWDPFDVYITLVNLVSVAYILTIAFHLVRDNKSEDAVAFGLSNHEKRVITQKRLNKYRKKAASKTNSKITKKRD